MMLVAAGWGEAQDLPQVLKGPPPAWAEPLPLDLANSKVSDTAAEEGGTWFLLHDEQTLGAEHTSYFHYATKYLTEGAVEDDSQITISVNPAYQKLTINSLVIHRDGKVLDRLAKQEIKLLQRESRLDWNLFDGRLSAILILDDLRVGDVVEYSYTLQGANPIFGRHFMDSSYLEWTEPVETFRYRLLWPSDRYLGTKAHNSSIEPKTRSLPKGLTEYVWEQKDIPASNYEGNIPGWFSPWAWVQLTDFRSWNDVAKWAHSIYPIPKKLPDELVAELSRIKAIEGKQEQVVAALRYVQDNIRYLGIEVGANSHEPHPVEVVLERRFGDCKDKSLMLSIMLRDLGVEAYPALVSTDTRKGISEWLPSPFAFNHVVTQVVLDGKTYWLDPTIRKQGGGLSQLFFPAYGWALIVRPDATGLTEVKPGGFAESFTHVTESFDFKDFKGDATLKVRTIYTGDEADRMRSYIADTRRSEIRKSYLNYYAHQFPGIKAVEPPRFQDDLQKNRLIGEESYEIKDFWTLDERKKGSVVGDFSAGTIRHKLKTPDTPQRSMPLAQSYPEKSRHVIEMSFPRKMNFTNEKDVVTEPSFRFVYEAVSQENKLTLSYDYESREDFVAAEKVNTYLTSQQAVRDLLGYRVTIPKSWVSPETVVETPKQTTAWERAEGGIALFFLIALQATSLVVAVIIGLVTWKVTTEKV